MGYPIGYLSLGKAHAALDDLQKETTVRLMRALDKTDGGRRCCRLPMDHNQVIRTSAEKDATP